MRVILLDDVERVGHEGDILKVADGYARNFLLPKHLAVEATRGALVELERRRTAITAREEDKRAKARARADEMSQMRIVVTARAGQGTRLHGQVTPQMISDAAKAQLNVEIDKRDIDIAEPIRELGEYLISAKLYKDVAAQLPVTVVREGGDEPEEAPAPKAEEAPAAEDAPAAEEPAAAEEAAEDAPADAEQ
jgi:large subunit ribosomal protein L9